jgi:hypothetical protein
VSWVVSIIIVLLTGATNLSRTKERNAIESGSRLPVGAASPVGP